MTSIPTNGIAIVMQIGEAQLPWLLGALLLVLLLAVWLGVRLAAWWSSIAQRERQETATRGEADAEVLLAAHGYRVVERQASARVQMEIDGAWCEGGLRADLIVERDGVRMVAEVKTGAQAPDPLFPSTRRQLLEYWWAFGGDAVLLVDVAQRAVHVVRFDGDRGRALRGRRRVSASDRSRARA